MAKKVLEGNTRGYKNHSQLIRFKKTQDPLTAINFYLSFILEEAVFRGYVFNREKISWEKCIGDCPVISVTSGQMEFERKHLEEKLRIRDEDKYKELLRIGVLDPHPLFEVVEGRIEAWEVVKE